MRAHRVFPGFSLAELFLSLALLSALLTLGMIYAHRISGVMGHRPPAEALRQLISEAHIAARTAGAPVYLSFNAEEATAELHNADGHQIGSLALASEDDASGFQMRIYRILPETKLDGTPAYEIEEEPVSYLLFHPAGPSVPAEIHLSSPSETQVFQIDPFSSAPPLIPDPDE